MQIFIISLAFSMIPEDPSFLSGTILLQSEEHAISVKAHLSWKFCFPLSENILALLLILKDTFAGCRLLSQQRLFFSFSINFKCVYFYNRMLLK